MTARTVGLRLAEGILASEARLNGDLCLELLVGMEGAERSGHVGATGVVGFAEAFEIPAHVTADSSLATLDPGDVDYVLVAGWPFRIRRPATGIKFLGLHPRRLPGGRGRSPISWTIAAREPCTELTLFALSETFDAGPILHAHPVSLRRNEDATSLFLRMSAEHQVVGERLYEILSDSMESLQDEAAARTWPHRTSADCLLAPGMTVADAHLLLRAQTPPFPPPLVVHEGATYVIDSAATLARRCPDGRRLLDFSCADGTINLTVHHSEPGQGASNAIFPVHRDS
ncbi:hypothetical protein [Micromonospora sp. NPDC004704]